MVDLRSFLGGGRERGYLDWRARCLGERWVGFCVARSALLACWRWIGADKPAAAGTGGWEVHAVRVVLVTLPPGTAGRQPSKQARAIAADEPVGFRNRWRLEAGGWGAQQGRGELGR